MKNLSSIIAAAAAFVGITGATTSVLAYDLACNSYNATYNRCVITGIKIRKSGLSASGGQWVPPKTRGDGEFQGCKKGEPIWDISVEARPCNFDNGGKAHSVCLDWGMEAHETNGDLTTVDGGDTARVYTTSGTKYIYKGGVKNSDGNPAQFTHHGHEDKGDGNWCWNSQVFNLGSTPTVSRLEVFGDTNGDDAGVFTGFKADLNPIVFYVSR